MSSGRAARKSGSYSSGWSACFAEAGSSHSVSVVVGVVASRSRALARRVAMKFDWVRVELPWLRPESLLGLLRREGPATERFGGGRIRFLCGDWGRMDCALG
jgi:hypothetical protein